MSRISKLSKLSNISRIGTSASSTSRRAFGFDGTNDYISSNATIGRTGYDMNVSGNVSTGSDADGSYIQFNGNRDATIPTGTNAEIQTTTNPTINQTTSFTISAKFKFNGVVPTGGSMGIFGRSNIISLYADNSAGTNLAKFRIRNGGTFTDVTFTATASTVYTIHGVYDTSVNKMYLYVNGTLQNIGGTTVGAATFGGSQNFILGDGGLGGGNVKSLSTYIYHACIRNKALSQAEVDADIALGNTTKNDPSIVAYYIPDNLTYNTQYMTAPKTFGGAGRSVRSNATVTTNNATAPDGATTASTYVINAAGTQITNAVEQSITSISGSTIASKTFIVKAFVRVVSGSNTFRLKCSHAGVADYYSSNQVATTTRQEFTFTQTFTSSTSGTGINAGLTSDTSNTAGSFEVRNVRLYLVNETLRDESPNIGGFIGWKQNRVISCWLKPGVDGTGTFNSQPFFTLPYIYGYIRESTNSVRVRYSDRLGNNETSYTLGAGFRRKVHICTVPYFTGTVRANKLYINGVLQNTGSYSLTPCNSILQTNLTIGRYFTPTYFTGNIRDARIYTFTGSFTDADALAIYNGGEPTSSGITKYLHYRPPVGEVGTTTQDQSPNDRDGTLNGGVKRNYI